MNAYVIISGAAGTAVAVASAYVVYATIRHAPHPSPLEAVVRARWAARKLDKELAGIRKSPESR